MRSTDYYRPGWDALRLRNGVVKAVDATQGTCTLLIDEEEIEDVPVYRGVNVNDEVRVLESRHSLLVLGER